MYTLNPPSTDGSPSTIKRIHPTRIIHVADSALDDTAYGLPCLAPVFNLLDDLLKVVGGSAEMFWQSADRILQFDIDKEMELSDEDEADFSDEVDELVHGIRRVVRTRGTKAQAISGAAPEPDKTVSEILKLISAATNVPLAVLLGHADRGQGFDGSVKLFNSRVLQRQRQFCEPTILRPLINRLQLVNVLPTVEYKIAWTDLLALTSAERIARAEAVGRAVRNMQRSIELAIKFGIEPLIGPSEIRKMVELDPNGPHEDIEFIRPPMDSKLIAKPNPGEQTQEAVGAPNINTSAVDVAELIELLEELQGSVAEIKRMKS
jgi:hypothetical protein